MIVTRNYKRNKMLIPHWLVDCPVPKNWANNLLTRIKNAKSFDGSKLPENHNQLLLLQDSWLDKMPMSAKKGVVI